MGYTERDYGPLYKELKPGQKRIFKKLVNGQNTFITGNAGTGKSFLVKAFDEFCIKNGINLVKTAPTGVAAIEIGGATLHRQFQLNVDLDLNFHKITKASVAKNDKYGFLKYTDILLIDEISMVRIDIFDKIMTIIQKANEIRKENDDKPIQLIFVGDFFQLPPVISNKDNSSNILAEFYGKDVENGFCFQSRMWKEFDIVTENLLEVIRQDDVEFCKALDKCKLGDASCIKYMTEHSSKTEIEGAIWLCGKNKTAEIYNNKGLEQIDSALHISQAIYSGEANDKDKLCENEFRYKIGATVVMLTNDAEGRYQNGSLGTILESDGDCITVQINRNGEEVEIERQEYKKVTYDFKDVEYRFTLSGELIDKKDWDSHTEYTTEFHRELVKEEKGTVKQFPMKLGYAVTIHKSQGQTYDAMNFEPEIFEIGQLYVALSRCKSVDQIYIKSPLWPRMVRCSDEVRKFYKDAENYGFFEAPVKKINMQIPEKYAQQVQDLISRLEREEMEENSGMNNNLVPPSVNYMEQQYGAPVPMNNVVSHTPHSNGFYSNNCGAQSVQPGYSENHPDYSAFMFFSQKAF